MQVNFNRVSFNQIFDNPKKHGVEENHTQQVQRECWGEISHYPMPFCGQCEDLNYVLNKYPEDFFPPRVYEVITSEDLPEGTTLYEAHKEAYKDLKDCDTLEEVKFFFPEFVDVKSANEMNVYKNSLLDKIQKGEIKGVDPDTDVSVSFIKLLYSDALSLLDMENLFGTRVDSLAKRLNIDLLDKKYAVTLKSSDSDFAKKHAQVLSNALTGLKRKSSKRGESPLKGRELTEEHKLKISKALQEYYTDPLNRKSNGYWKNNPDAREILSEIMTNAWEYADVAKSELSEFLTGRGFTVDERDSFKTIADRNSFLLKDFWREHPNAKQDLSVSLARAWAEYKCEKFDEKEYLAQYESKIKESKNDVTLGNPKSSPLGVNVVASEDNPLKNAKIRQATQALEGKVAELSELSYDEISEYKSGISSYRDYTKALIGVGYKNLLIDKFKDLANAGKVHNVLSIDAMLLSNYLRASDDKYANKKFMREMRDSLNKINPELKAEAEPLSRLSREERYWNLFTNRIYSVAKNAEGDNAYQRLVFVDVISKIGETDYHSLKLLENLIDAEAQKDFGSYIDLLENYRNRGNDLTGTQKNGNDVSIDEVLYDFQLMKMQGYF